MGKKREVWRVILLTLAFWALVIFGPALVMLWNALQPFYNRYQPGDLGYLILMTVAQGIACGLAFYAAESIGDDRHDMAILVNTVVAATILGLVGLYELIVQNWQDAIALLLGTVVVIMESVFTAKEIRKKQTDSGKNT